MRQLPLIFAQTACDLDASVIVMEEVPQAAKHVLAPVCEIFKANGFDVHSRVINTQDLGIPQSRRRLIVVATRRGWTFEWPATDRPAVSVAEALAAHPSPAIGAVVSEHAAMRIRQVRDSGKRLIGGNYQIMDVSKPSPTIHTRSVAGAGPYAIERDGVFHTLSAEEAARLQSFPDDYRFLGGDTRKRKLIGNSVPPSLAYAIASNISPPRVGRS